MKYSKQFHTTAAGGSSSSSSSNNSSSSSRSCSRRIASYHDSRQSLGLDNWRQLGSDSTDEGIARMLELQRVGCNQIAIKCFPLLYTWNICNPEDWNLRHWHVIDTSLTRHWHVIDTSLTRHWHVINTSWTRHWHVIDTSLTRHWHVNDTHWHVIDTSLTRHWRHCHCRSPYETRQYLIPYIVYCREEDSNPDLSRSVQRLNNIIMIIIIWSGETVTVAHLVVQTQKCELLCN